MEQGAEFVEGRFSSVVVRVLHNVVEDVFIRDKVGNEGGVGYLTGEGDEGESGAGLKLDCFEKNFVGGHCLSFKNNE